MRKLIVCNIISVDGFYSGPNDDVMAMPFDVTFSDYNAERLRAADTLLLGRRSFEGFQSYWPSVADDVDAPPVERLRAAFVATRIAEQFRDAGEDVVLIMDSLTRVAMAQREIGLSAGEPPATRGYPPSVFGLLPRLLERAGPGEVGSITGIYTVLVEGDDMQDPIGDTARSILDGHVVLSRRLATSGHFPAIDVLESVSRVVSAVTTPEQRGDAVALRRLLAAHRDVRELVEIGAYVPGGNPDADRAIALLPLVDEFLRQDLDERSSAAETWQRLHTLLETT